MFLLFAVLLTVLCVSAAFGAQKWTLRKGDAVLGDVAVEVRDGATLASISGAAGKTGVGVKEEGKKLVLSFHSRKAVFLPEDVMVFVNGEIFPLTAPIRRENGRWWAEAHGLLEVLEILLYGRNDAPEPLRWKGGGSGDMPSFPGTPKPTQPPAAPSPAGGLSSEALLEQWRKEFAPGPPASSSLVRRLRWKKHEDKVRLVFDLAEQYSPEVHKASGKLDLSFSQKISSSVEGGISPFPREIRMSWEKHSGGTSVCFRHDAPEVVTFSLAHPPRFVVDFMLSEKKTPPSLPSPLQPTPVPVSLGPLPSYTPVRSGAPLVVVDAGHGGKDPGAVANGLKEKDINLKISSYLAKELQKRGCKVLLTRGDDRYLRLRERTAFANAKNADVFVSIHVNALPKGRHAKGMEVYLMALPSDKDAMALAKIENRELAEGNGHSGTSASDAKTEMLLHILGDMQQNAKIADSMAFAEVLFQQGKRSGLPMRRVAQAPFFVLRGAGMPAVLVETGFMTEKSEAKKLRLASYQQKIALSLAQGIVDFLRKK